MEFCFRRPIIGAGHYREEELPPAQSYVDDHWFLSEIQQRKQAQQQYTEI